MSISWENLSAGGCKGCWGPRRQSCLQGSLGIYSKRLSCPAATCPGGRALYRWFTVDFTLLTKFCHYILETVELQLSAQVHLQGYPGVKRQGATQNTTVSLYTSMSGKDGSWDFHQGLRIGVQAQKLTEGNSISSVGNKHLFCQIKLNY